MSVITYFFHSILNHKLNRDIAWTFASFAILAVSGVLMNILIVLFRDAASLGVFNLSYSIYLIGSQVAVMGIHNSVMRYSAYYHDDPFERGGMFCSAMLLTLMLGVTIGLLVYFSTPLFENLFSSREAAEAIGYTGFGLMLFPLNKVLIGYINGIRHMRALAILQTSRYLTVLLAVALISISDSQFTYVSLSFFAAEFLTTISTVIYLGKAGLLKHLKFTGRWMKEHLIFGGKGALGSIFLDMNTRIDVLMIGFFLNDKAVGIYSFAAMFIDGLQHILSMLRVNFNPVLVAAMRDQDWPQAKKLLHNSKIYATFGVVVLTVIVLACFYIFIKFFAHDKSLMEGWKILAIMFSTYILIAGYSPFDNFLLASGYPSKQTIQNVSIALVNFVMCLMLIPVFGIVGAAISTAISYIVGTLLMIFFSYRLLGWNMLTNSQKSR